MFGTESTHFGNFHIKEIYASLESNLPLLHLTFMYVDKVHSFFLEKQAAKSKIRTLPKISTTFLEASIIKNVHV